MESTTLPRGDARAVEALQAGDEEAFAALVRAHGASMLRVARLYVGSRAVAEEVVQEAWLGVLSGIDRFEGRAPLKTWIFRILANTAKTRAVREARTLPFSAVANDDERAVEAERFLPADHERWPRHWAAAPRSWSERPDDRLLARETREVVRRAVEALPEQQRAVVSLRDIEGWSSEEVRNVLGVSETNQRVLLHRGRSKVRRELERYMDAGAE